MRAAAPDEAAQRVSNLSRAYRVNLTVLALVALFTGAFLVFSVLSLSVAKRQPQFALLGVLGLTARAAAARWCWPSRRCSAPSAASLGIALGTALAALALRVLGGDLGGGYFAGVAPALQFERAGGRRSTALLGVVAALRRRLAAGARGAAHRAGAGAEGPRQRAPARARPAPSACVLLRPASLLALLPPVAGIPLAAYVSVALPAGRRHRLRARRRRRCCSPAAPRRAPRSPLLAVERARHQRDSATIAVAGVVASLSLAVALTVMVGELSRLGARTGSTSCCRPTCTCAPASAPARRRPPRCRPSCLRAAASMPGVARAERAARASRCCSIRRGRRWR